MHNFKYFPLHGITCNIKKGPSHFKLKTISFLLYLKMKILLLVLQTNSSDALINQNERRELT